MRERYPLNTNLLCTGSMPMPRQMPSWKWSTMWLNLMVFMVCSVGIYKYAEFKINELVWKHFDAQIERERKEKAFESINLWPSTNESLYLENLRSLCAYRSIFINGLSNGLTRYIDTYTYSISKTNRLHRTEESSYEKTKKYVIP